MIPVVSPALVDQARRAAAARAAHRWHLAGLALLIFAAGFVTACGVIAHWLL